VVVTLIKDLAKWFLGKWFSFRLKGIWQECYDDELVDSILFICLKPTGIGDALMNTPAYRAVRFNYPDAKITLITDKDILRGSPCVDEILLVKDWKEALKVKERYDLVVLPNKNLLASFVAFRARRRFVIGYLTSWEVKANFPKHMHLEFNKKYTHLYDMANLAVEPLISDKADLTPVLEPLLYSEEEMERVKKLINYKESDKLIVMSPAGLWPSRTWEGTNYAELARKLVDDGYKVVFNGSKEDEYYNNVVAAKAQNVVTNVTGELNLYELAALFKLSRLAILNDSGPMHIAVAMGTKTLTLWGPTHPHRRLPKHLLNKTCFYLCPGDYCEDAYDFETPPENHDRINLITVDEVYSKVVDILQTEKYIN
jgi:ADP-heptose:LPS heptosyltransferase